MAYKQEQITPYGKGGKQEQIRRMFDKIAPSYDRLNHALSLGIDRRWRRTAIDALGKHFPPEGGQGLLLDIATGTGDFAMLLAERIKPQHIIGEKFVKETSDEDIAKRIEKNVLNYLVKTKN